MIWMIICRIYVWCIGLPAQLVCYRFMHVGFQGGKLMVTHLVDSMGKVIFFFFSKIRLFFRSCYHSIICVFCMKIKKIAFCRVSQFTHVPIFDKKWFLLNKQKYNSLWINKIDPNSDMAFGWSTNMTRTHLLMKHLFCMINKNDCLWVNKIDPNPHIDEISFLFDKKYAFFGPQLKTIPFHTRLTWLVECTWPIVNGFIEIAYSTTTTFNC